MASAADVLYGPAFCRHKRFPAFLVLPRRNRFTHACRKDTGFQRGSEYVDCFSKKMHSYAQFSIPIAFGRTDDGQSASGGKSIELVSTDSVLLGVTIPEEIKGKLDRIKEDSFGMIDFDDFTVQIKIENDTESDYPFGVFASYIDEGPYQYENLTSLKGKSFIVRMSDVSVDHAMIKGSSVVLMPSGG